MFNILILMPDSIPIGMGGLSTHMNNLLKDFDSSFYFHVIGADKSDKTIRTGNNYTFYPVTRDNNYADDWVIYPTAIIDSYIKHIHNKTKIDLVHCCDWNTIVAGEFVAELLKIKKIIAFHLPLNLDNEQDLSNWITYTQYILEKDAHENFDKVIYVSEYIKLKAETHGFNGSNMITIPNGINVDEFEDVERIELGDFKHKYLFIGRAVAQKGIYELLDTYIDEDSALYIVAPENGSDPEAIKMIKEACELSNNIFYLGEKHGEEKIQILKSVDYVVMPSLYEPFGIVALEAFASFRILITSGVHGLSDFTNNENSIQIKRVHSMHIREAMLKAKGLSFIERSAMKLIANTISKSYTWDKVRKQYLTIYNELL